MNVTVKKVDHLDTWSVELPWETKAKIGKVVNVTSGLVAVGLIVYFYQKQ